MYKLDSRLDKPLYRQIVDQTIDFIIKGYLLEGEKIGSVREMSKELLVNSSTIVRAYKELEDLGYIETRPGSGSYISIDKEKIEKEEKLVLKDLRILMKKAIFLDISLDRIGEIYEEVREDLND